MQNMNRDQIEAHIKALQEASADAYKEYDRAFRQIGANDAECGEKYYAWQNANEAVQEAKYQRDLGAYQFAERLGTARFMKKPQRASYY